MANVIFECFLEHSVRAQTVARRPVLDGNRAINVFAILQKAGDLGGVEPLPSINSACPIPVYRLHYIDMHIGELARKAAVNIQTIRFYERKSLLPVPPRDMSGYRCYERGDLDRVTFIKRNQELGFTLEEIRQLLELHRKVAAMSFPLRHKPSELRAIIAIGHERLEAVNQKVRALHHIRRRLTSLLEQLDAATVATCPASKSAPSTSRKKSPQTA